MGPRWLALVCLALPALATPAHAAALSTEDPNTFIVAKSKEDGKKEETALETTTEEPNPPIKVTEMEVESVVALRYARTAVVARVRNPARRAQEAAFRVLLPDTAFITGFTMILDGKPYKAYVKEKEEAKEIYNQAISQGIGAAHIAAKARDSNHFTVSVNVEANSTAVFNLTYEELLVRRDQVYSHAVNLHPGAPVPRLAVTVRVRETARLRSLRVPPVRTGNEVDAVDDGAQNPIAVIERGHDDREATITFKPDLEEQRRLAEIYAEKSKESQSHSYDRYDENGENNKPEGILGQFVVQYDVEQPKNGEILVNDGYFVHFFAPSELPPLNKHVVFVLDTSGSMGGRKIDQLREAMQTILSELNKGDYFSIVEFDSNVQVHDLKEADEEPRPIEDYYVFAARPNRAVVKVPPAPATPLNVAKAKVIVSRLTAQGGTNIYDALDTAVELINKGVDWTPTPAASTTEKKDNTTKEEDVGKKEKRKDASVVEKPAESNSEVEETKKLEPIIIFLTDGDPTTGETNPTKIINRITEKNYGPNKASLFSLAFGEDADRSFLRKLSLRNEGFMRHIYEAADAALQLRAFYRQVASPLLAHVQFVYPPEQVKEGSVTKNKFRTIYGGSETVVAGRVADLGAELQPQVIGFCGVDDGFIRKQYEMKPVKRRASGYLPLERLWAYLTIKQLLDERDAIDSGDGDKGSTSPGKRALELALKYEFVTPLTSLVVVKPNATDAVNAESVDQQNGLGPLGGAGGIGIPLAASSFSSFNPQPIMHSPPQFAYKAAFPSAIGQLAGQPGPPEFATDIRLDEYLPEYDQDTESTRRGSVRRGRPRPRYMTRYSSRNIQATGKRAHDDVDSILPARVLSTEAPSPTTDAPAATAPAPALGLLQPYHLEAYPWVASLLVSGADAIRIEENGNQTLQLSKDEAAPKAGGGDAECANATDGGPGGACVYLTRCQPARDLFANHYVHFHCAVDQKYAGVCCPKAKVDITTA